MVIDQVEIIWRISFATSSRCNYLIAVSYNLNPRSGFMLLTQGFSSCLITAEKSFRTSFCYFIRHLQSSKFRPFVFCTALLFSSVSLGQSTQGEYQSNKLHVDYEQNNVILSFSGSTPKSLNGFASYRIRSINLKIGGKKYPVKEQDDFSQLVSMMKLEDVGYPVDNFPQSKLVFSYSLTFTQFLTESRKCVSTHSSWLWYLWDLLFNSDFKACNKMYGMPI